MGPGIALVWDQTDLKNAEVSHACYLAFTSSERVVHVIAQMSELLSHPLHAPRKGT